LIILDTNLLSALMQSIPEPSVVEWLDQQPAESADSPDRFTRWDRVLGELPMVIAPNAREAARSAPVRAMSTDRCHSTFRE
jgi:hypothetical protein